jgi:hypothetical protein
MMSSILGFFAFILIMIPACVSFGDHNTYRNSIAAILVFLGVFTILDLVSEYIRVMFAHFFGFFLLEATRSRLLRLCWLPISAKVRTAVCSRGQVLWRLWPRCCGSSVHSSCLQP